MDDPAVPGTETPASPPATKPAPAHDFPFLIAAGIALVAALVLVRNLLPAKQDLADTLRREDALQRKLEDLAKEKSTLEMREKALKDDPAYIERSLRDQTGMTRPGEVIVR